MSRRKTNLPARRWSRFRQTILERDRHRCRSCGKAGRLEVDHIIPLSKGGEAWDPDNCQSLCRSCHIEKTAAENSRGLQLSEGALGEAA